MTERPINTGLPEGDIQFKQNFSWWQRRCLNSTIRKVRKPSVKDLKEKRNWSVDLASFGPQAFDTLSHFLTDGDSVVRAYTLEALFLIDRPRANEKLVHLLKTNTRELPQNSFEKLTETLLKEESLPILRNYLKNYIEEGDKPEELDYGDGYYCAETLVTQDDPNSIDVLKDWFVYLVASTYDRFGRRREHWEKLLNYFSIHNIDFANDAVAHTIEKLAEFPQKRISPFQFKLSEILVLGYQLLPYLISRYHKIRQNEGNKMKLSLDYYLACIDLLIPLAQKEDLTLENKLELVSGDEQLLSIFYKNLLLDEADLRKVFEIEKPQEKGGGLTLEHWKQVLEVYTNPKFKAAKHKVYPEITQYVHAILTGKLEPGGFHHRNFLGRRHWKKIANDLDELNYYTRHNNPTYQYITLKEQLYVRDCLEFAKSECNAVYSVNDYIENKGIKMLLFHPLEWDEQQQFWNHVVEYKIWNDEPGRTELQQVSNEDWGEVYTGGYYSTHKKVREAIPSDFPNVCNLLTTDLIHTSPNEFKTHIMQLAQTNRIAVRRIIMATKNLYPRPSLHSRVGYLEQPIPQAL